MTGLEEKLELCFSVITNESGKGDYAKVGAQVLEEWTFADEFYVGKLADGSPFLAARAAQGESISSATYGQIVEVEEVMLDGSPCRRTLLRRRADLTDVLCRQIGTIYYDIYGKRNPLPPAIRDAEFHRQLRELEETFAWRKPLTDEHVVGLFGELKVLEKALFLARERNIPDPRILSKWKGPERGIRDFESIAGSIEVKTVRKPAADSSCLRNIKMNHLRQIELCLEHGRHGLVIVPVKKDGAGETVLELADRLTGTYGINRLALVGLMKRYLGTEIDTDSSDPLKSRYLPIHDNGLGWGFDMADDLPRVEACGAVPSVHENGVCFSIDLDRVPSLPDGGLWELISNLAKDEQ